jgi:hypothetical protein
MHTKGGAHPQRRHVVISSRLSFLQQPLVPADTQCGLASARGRHGLTVLLSV